MIQNMPKSKPFCTGFDKWSLQLNQHILNNLKNRILRHILGYCDDVALSKTAAGNVNHGFSKVLNSRHEIKSYQN